MKNGEAEALGDFDLEATFGDYYLYFYAHRLGDERSESEVVISRPFEPEGPVRRSRMSPVATAA